LSAFFCRESTSTSAWLREVCAGRAPQGPFARTDQRPGSRRRPPQTGALWQAMLNATPSPSAGPTTTEEVQEWRSETRSFPSDRGSCQFESVAYLGDPLCRFLQEKQRTPKSATTTGLARSAASTRQTAIGQATVPEILHSGRRTLKSSRCRRARGHI